MPLYPYECPKCGQAEDIITPVNFMASCKKCGTVMKRKFHAQFGINRGPVPAAGYFDDNLGCFIRTNTHRKEVMKEQGVSEKPSKKVWFR